MAAATESITIYPDAALRVAKLGKLTTLQTTLYMCVLQYEGVKMNEGKGIVVKSTDKR